jgi:hypothetical protein
VVNFAPASSEKGQEALPGGASYPIQIDFAEHEKLLPVRQSKSFNSESIVGG